MANNKGVIADNKKPLKYHNRREHPLHRLPFVHLRKNKSGASFWAVPRTGSYQGSVEAGEALACMYLKHLREHGASPCGNLQHVVLEMCGMGSLGVHLTQEQNSLAGQIVGFFSTLDGWLAASAKGFGRNLDGANPSDLLAKANSGIELRNPASGAK
ncbi:hypothetical protein [Serratia sp. PL7]|uniref:hypothetical protein n=1 Tax=Serratia sp. PL7 TaxID=2952201 RepID=UPI0021ADDBB1|nr:hypothetical protein [Serratia sp. PL7]